MKIRNSVILFGLSANEQHLLRSLCEAASASKPAPAWLTATEHAESLARLLGAGLISEKLRLTLQGLVIAVNLPKQCQGSLCFAA
jgi:hypothetical protein